MHVQVIWELADLPVQQSNTFIGGNAIHLYVKGTYIQSLSPYFMNVSISVFSGCAMKHMGSSETRKTCVAMTSI